VSWFCFVLKGIQTVRLGKGTGVKNVKKLRFMLAFRTARVSQAAENLMHACTSMEEQPFRAASNVRINRGL
jgi:hypothetical protein